MYAAESIFGPTFEGVPNPFVPHAHPYPTRYHGPLWQEVRAGGVYQPSVWNVPIEYTRGVGASPDGLGAFEMAPSGTGMVLRALAGAAVGAAGAWAARSTKAPEAVLAASAAFATALFGPEGMGASIAAIFLVSRRKP